MNQPLDLSTLPRLPVARLRALWSQHMGRASPPPQKCLLVRDLAWRLQARAHGGRDRPTQRLLRRAMREAVAELRRRRGTTGSTGYATSPAMDPSPRVPRGGGHALRSDAPQDSCRRRRAEAAPELSPGTRLVRTWHGTRHEVHVLADGRFTHRGQTYASLSEIARAITGAHWSGPRFFGVTTRARGNDDNTRTSGGAGSRGRGGRGGRGNHPIAASRARLNRSGGGVGPDTGGAP